MKSCPDCKQSNSVRAARPHGAWEKRVFRWLGFKPFWCSSCARRFVRFQLGSGRVRRSRKQEPTQEQLPNLTAAEENSGFQELIRDIREAERKMAAEPLDYRKVTKK